MKAYYKRNAIPPASGRPRYNWSVLSDDRKMRFSFSISNCLADTKVCYSRREPNICLLCLTSASYKEKETTEFKPIDYSRGAKGKKRLAIKVFEADILPKIEKIISTEK